MKKRIAIFYRCLKRFGLAQGIKLYYCYAFNKLSGIKIPGIKNPISLRKDTTDFELFNYIFLGREYDYINYPNNTKIIIDGGANIGFFTILMKNRFPNSKIISVEPDTDNFIQLQNNVSSYDNVFCENCGLWNKQTLLKVYDKYNQGKWSIIVEEDLTKGSIQAISINSLVNKYSIEKIDILKLDIESSEKEVFSDNYHEWLSITKMIVIEIHDGRKENCARTFFEAINKTFKRYKFSHLGENVIIVNMDLD